MSGPQRFLVNFSGGDPSLTTAIVPNDGWRKGPGKAGKKGMQGKTGAQKKPPVGAENTERSINQYATEWPICQWLKPGIQNRKAKNRHFLIGDGLGRRLAAGNGVQLLPVLPT